MSQARAVQYLKCIEPLMAEEALSQLPIVSFPHMKKDRARGLEKELKKRTQANVHKKQTQHTTADMYRELLRTLGNG